MADIFDAYRPARAWDEMFAAPGVPRTPYLAVFAALQRLGANDLRYRADQVARLFTDRGVTFAFAGDEQPFPLDQIPRVLAAQEWDEVTRGVAQRIRALEAFLADVYGRGRVLEDGVVPRALVLSSPHFHRAAAGIEPPGGVRVHVGGIDLVRDEEGRFRVLEDNVRIPSGVSYVIENRRAGTRLFPGIFAEHRVRAVDAYPARLLASLRATAPEGVADPTAVVLTPGRYNAAYFEHTLLARLMGIPLVEGRDLECHRNHVYMRTTRGRRPVHVIYRRVDDDFLDPLHFRGDSLLGTPGLLNAARAGNVTLANAVGNGVADDKLLYTYVPDLIRYYLAEEPALDNVETYRLDSPDRVAWVLEHAHELVLKPVDGSGGKGIVIGPHAEEAELAVLRAAVAADPRGWIAQRPVALSTAPTLIGDRLEPRHVDLRPFAINDGTDIWLLPGGLTRVALPEGQLVVNSSQGGGSKDTWVLADGSRDGTGARKLVAVAAMPQSRDQQPSPFGDESAAGAAQQMQQ
ncbi:circularly permuted type 2 ATP-grasp protein [Yinghuangia soli]|uniref:Circularly permuted type 2 ATP-grasp protein n=1 Tax=Yinghuangia soli TaxID=2908204 RepID=A0AA41TZL5_9ACTN|nr:circularly permuted type 2 ATP-grasp protein [Yinghuangia soli]MCF2528943.1 circularly permuted type 2 ATP-grasp protein [Yinghuangia soli]